MYSVLFTRLIFNIDYTRCRDYTGQRQTGEFNWLVYSIDDCCHNVNVWLKCSGIKLYSYRLGKGEQLPIRRACVAEQLEPCYANSNEVNLSDLALRLTRFLLIFGLSTLNLGPSRSRSHTVGYTHQ